MAELRDQLQATLGDGFKIERELGGGGMSRVFVTTDRALDRQVVIKVLPPELGAAVNVERFRREIQFAARLQHPHIVPLLSAGEVDGLPYYTMPYVAGESLRARLDREGQLPVVEAVHHARAIASALDYAHRQGVVHRDIKPENIMLHEGEAMVMDFGIAKALSVAGTDTLTQAGVMVGTPAYVSPEQASGDTLDARTDQYSLACVLYEMLAGEKPFTGPTVPAMIARRLTHPVGPVRALRDSVPENVEHALTRAMSIDPDGRYVTAAEFADALAGAAPPARKPWGRRAAIGAVVVLIMAIVAFE